MIIIRLFGGLGNQMFQYALGRRLALERGVPLKLDLGWFGNQNKRKFELDQFNVDVEIATKQDIKKFPRFSQNRLVRGINNQVERIIPYNSRLFIKEQFCGHFDDRVLKVGKNTYLEGYWQSENYFKSIENRLRSDFTLSHPFSNEDQMLAEEMLNNKYSVSVHIRRGDYISEYITKQIFYVCTPDYYNETLHLISEKLLEKAFFYVFSDDPDWCHSNMNFPSGYKIVSNQERSAAHEIILMSKCQHAVIANSSFSWWGAWLGEKQNSIIIAPSRWVNGRSYHKDLLPERWIKN